MTGAMADVRSRIRGFVDALLGRLGWQLVRSIPPPEPSPPPTVDDGTVVTRAVSPFPMPAPERDPHLPATRLRRRDDRHDQSGLAVHDDIARTRGRPGQRAGLRVPVPDPLARGGMWSLARWEHDGDRQNVAGQERPSGALPVRHLRRDDGANGNRHRSCRPFGTRAMLATEDRDTSDVCPRSARRWKGQHALDGLPSRLYPHVRGPVERPCRRRRRKRSRCCGWTRISTSRRAMNWSI